MEAAMNLEELSEKLDTMSSVLKLIQDYITLKFGSDFREYTESWNTRQKQRQSSSLSSLPLEKRKKTTKRRGRPPLASYSQNPVEILGVEGYSNADDFSAPFEVTREMGSGPSHPIGIKRELVSDIDFDFEDVELEPLPNDNNNDGDDDSSRDVMEYEKDPDYNPSGNRSLSKRTRRESLNNQAVSDLSSDGESDKNVPLDVEFRVVKSKKKRPMILFGGFRYCLEKYVTNKIMWKCNCRLKLCRARLHSTDDINHLKLLKICGVHNHEPDTLKNETYIVLNKIREVARESSPSRKPQEIIDEVVATVPDHVKEKLPLSPALHRIIRRIFIEKRKKSGLLHDKEDSATGDSSNRRADESLLANLVVGSMPPFAVIPRENSQPDHGPLLGHLPPGPMPLSLLTPRPNAQPDDFQLGQMPPRTTAQPDHCQL